MRTIGFAANSNYMFWRDALSNVDGTQILDLLVGSPATDSVCMWFIVLAKTDNVLKLGFWLRSLRAPIVLVTPNTLVAQQLAPQVPKLAFVCHPICAAADLPTLMLLTTRRTGGSQVLHVPRSRATATPSTRRTGIWP